MKKVKYLIIAAVIVIAFVVGYNGHIASQQTAVNPVTNTATATPEITTISPLATPTEIIVAPAIATEAIVASATEIK